MSARDPGIPIDGVHVGDEQHVAESEHGDEPVRGADDPYLLGPEEPIAVIDPGIRWVVSAEPDPRVRRSTGAVFVEPRGELRVVRISV